MIACNAYTSYHYRHVEYTDRTTRTQLKGADLEGRILCGRATN
jgi:hypothetical protein